MKYYEQIQFLQLPSEREKEIKENHSTKRGIERAYLREYRMAQLQRENQLKALLVEAWEKLQVLNYRKFNYRANASYDSGHSDFIEHSQDVVKIGVIAPDGTLFEGKAIWSEGILEALKHAGI